MSGTFGGKNVSDNRQASGFTLVEMVIVIVVVGILLAISFPYFHELIVSNNITAATNQLLGEINVAKSEALRRGTLVGVISTSGTSTWTTGWYVESDGDFLNTGAFSGNPPAASSNDVLLRTNTGIAANGYSITTAITATVCATATTTASAGTLLFNSKGNQPCNVVAFDINVCRPDSKPTRSKHISIAASGLVTVKTDTTGSPAPSC